MTANRTLHDVLIIGGGPAGLATGTGLARQLYTAVVFDSGVYRNARASHMHIVLGSDHIPPAEYRAKARQDLLARYSTTSFEDVEIKSVQRTAQGLFRATDANSRDWYGRKLVLATGVTDIYPDIPGYGDCFGYGIFHCLFCHGYEDRGAESIGVLAITATANAKVAMHLAYMAKPLGKKVTIYTNGNEALTTELVELASNPPFQIDPRPIKSLAMGPKKPQVVISFGDGEKPVTEGFLAHAANTKVNGPFAEQLGLELAANGDIKTQQPFGETSMPGVYAAGDCANMVKAAAVAVASGGLCAGGIVVPLASEPRVELKL